MRPRPDTLAEALERFLRACEAEAPSAVATLRRLRDGWLEAGGRDAEARLQAARSVEALYGGTGSINDFPWSVEAAEAKELLWLAARAAAREAWRDSGHESHDPASVALLAVGTRVRARAGAALVVRSDGSHVPVPRDAARRTWEVRGVEDPDVTGMPLYSLKSGDRFLLARHDALERLG